MKRPPHEGQSPQEEAPQKVSRSPEGTEMPYGSKPGMFPVAWDWEKIGKLAPAVLDALAKLIDAFAKLMK